MKNRITRLLDENPGLKGREIARELELDRKAVSSFLYKNLDTFVQDPETFGWSLLANTHFVLELTSSRTWLTQDHFEKILLKSGSPLDTDHSNVVIKVTDERKVLLCAAARILSLANQLAASGKKVGLDFTNNEGTISYLDRAGFFDRLEKSVSVVPQRPSSSAAQRFMANNIGLVELLEIEALPKNDDTFDVGPSVPHRIKESFSEVFGSKNANKLFTVAGELVGNVQEHSETAIPGFAGLQAYGRDSNQTVVLVISDSGKGICATLRPGLHKHFPEIAKKFEPSVEAADPKLIRHIMLHRGLSRLGKGQGAGLHASHGIAEKLDAKVTIRQENFSVLMVYRAGTLEGSKFTLDLPKLHGTHIVFEFNLTKN
ncbi:MULTISPECIES: ATP-binding protein [unclassified Pseudomonas]|uniref:ATP-binding protein n=1 Tax=unclassified Pseudomonas TaxID=196821 RepID=UPI00244C4842|nr:MULTISPECIES: ATP-binding protein [unclassified Pseudomonas]MDG9927966.1 ATP-binding protein [Pseudomonas sp. GD04042]MDH0481975.1 ATP-binding protein [Pseudomonas sp. GD04015]MDH0604130.1 ATP-binding protein [Pseudomonas sp. GD03869]